MDGVGSADPRGSSGRREAERELSLHRLLAGSMRDNVVPGKINVFYHRTFCTL